MNTQVQPSVLVNPISNINSLIIENGFEPSEFYGLYSFSLKRGSTNLDYNDWATEELNRRIAPPINHNSDEQLDVLEDYGFKKSTHYGGGGYSVFEFDVYSNGKFTLVRGELEEFEVALFSGSVSDYLGETDGDSKFIRVFTSMESLIKYMNKNFK